jgi:Putative peptidoglycan binding domain
MSCGNDSSPPHARRWPPRPPPCVPDATVIRCSTPPRRGRGALLEAAAHGRAGGARHALSNYFTAEGLPVAVDGVYGPETADAVSAFQEQERLTVDGAVSPPTAEAHGLWSGWSGLLPPRRGAAPNPQRPEAATMVG